jgi:hypothetical protein
MFIFFAIHLLLQSSIVCEDSTCLTVVELSFDGVATASDCYNECKAVSISYFAEFAPPDVETGFSPTNCYCYDTINILGCFACPVDGGTVWSTIHDSDFDCSFLPVEDCS